MNPWIIIVFVLAAIIFGIDYLLRRKKWKDNVRGEKISLLVNMFTAGPYVFLSMLGLLWGIVAGNPQSAFAEMIYEATLVMSGIYYLVAIAAVIMSLVFRKKGKIKASIWVNVAALMYIAVVLAVNSLVG